MTDPLALEADPYHELSQTDRDHLLAVALADAKRGDPPKAQTITDTVDRLTGSIPHRGTTGRALDRLSVAGLVESVDEIPDGRARAVRVTDDGRRVLGRGASRLDAAATVE